MAETKKSIVATRRKLISKLRKRRPYFRRYHWFKYVLSDNWRRPRGIHSKMRRDETSKPATVNPGYCSAKAIKGLHPSGYEEIYVRNISELQKINRETQAGRLSAGIGGKKRAAISAKAKELKIKLLNA